MSKLEPLFVKYLNEPIKLDPNDCNDIADLIEKAKKEFELDFPLDKLIICRYTGTKIRPGLKINELLKQAEFENSDSTPLLIRCVDDGPPIAKKAKTAHHSEKRRERWEELNSILIQAEIEVGSAAYSSLDWSRISPVYERIINKYTQSVKEVPQKTIELLHNYLVILTRRLSSVTTGKDSQRLHFITPILFYVSDLFGPEDVQIVVEKDLNGVNVKANGHFEFILKRNNKRVCVVQAKKDDLEKGMVQNLIRMEVVSELDNLDTVYWIVTNNVEWIFLKSENDRIEKHRDIMNIDESENITVESLERFMLFFQSKFLE